MIPRDASPIGHVPPLPRIDLSPKRTAYPTDCKYPVCNCDPRCFMSPGLSQDECDRIWKLVKQCAEGTCAPTSSPSSTSSPTESSNTVTPGELEWTD